MVTSTADEAVAKGASTADEVVVEAAPTVDETVAQGASTADEAVAKGAPTADEAAAKGVSTGRCCHRGLAWGRGGHDPDGVADPGNQGHRGGQGCRQSAWRQGERSCWRQTRLWPWRPRSWPPPRLAANEVAALPVAAVSGGPCHGRGLRSPHGRSRKRRTRWPCWPRSYLADAARGPRSGRRPRLSLRGSRVPAAGAEVVSRGGRGTPRRWRRKPAAAEAAGNRVLAAAAGTEVVEWRPRPCPTSGEAPVSSRGGGDRGARSGGEGRGAGAAVEARGGCDLGSRVGGPGGRGPGRRCDGATAALAAVAPSAGPRWWPRRARSWRRPAEVVATCDAE